MKNCKIDVKVHISPNYMRKMHVKGCFLMFTDFLGVRLLSIMKLFKMSKIRCFSLFRCYLEKQRAYIAIQQND